MRRVMYQAVYLWPFFAGLALAAVLRGWIGLAIVPAAIVVWWLWAIWFVSFSPWDRRLRTRWNLLTMRERPITEWYAVRLNVGPVAAAPPPDATVFGTDRDRTRTPA